MEEVFERLQDVSPNFFKEEKDKFTSHQQCLAKWNSQLRKRSSAKIQPEADDSYQLHFKFDWKNMKLIQEAEYGNRERNLALITDALIQNMLLNDVEDDQM